MLDVYSPKKNYLLAALPKASYERLLPHLELVPLRLGSVIYEFHEQSKYLYFPIDCIVSRLKRMENGTTDEVAIAGNKGLVGIPLFLESEGVFSWSMVQMAGHAYVIDSEVIKTEFDHDSPLHQLLLRYTRALMTEVTQTLLCNRHHSTEQKVCRWLLLRSDRLPSNEFTGTRTLIANLLGEKAPAIVEAMTRLQDEGAIDYRTGQIIVRDRHILEGLVCDCYTVVSDAMDRLFPRRSQSRVLPKTRMPFSGVPSASLIDSGLR